MWRILTWKRSSRQSQCNILHTFKSYSWAFIAEFFLCSCVKSSWLTEYAQCSRMLCSLLEYSLQYREHKNIWGKELPRISAFRHFFVYATDLVPITLFWSRVSWQRLLYSSLVAVVGMIDAIRYGASNCFSSVPCYRFNHLCRCARIQPNIMKASVCIKKNYVHQLIHLIGRFMAVINSNNTTTLYYCNIQVYFF